MSEMRKDIRLLLSNNSTIYKMSILWISCTCISQVNEMEKGYRFYCKDKKVGIKVEITDDGYIKMHEYGFIRFINMLKNHCGINIEEVEYIAND